MVSSVDLDVRIGSVLRRRVERLGMASMSLRHISNSPNGACRPDGIILASAVSVRHGRERPPRPGRRSGLASPSTTITYPVGRPQRSYVEATPTAPSPQGRCPCTRWEPSTRGPAARVYRRFGVQGQRPCGGGVHTRARASERCGLPPERSVSTNDHARQGLRRCEMVARGYAEQNWLRSRVV